VLRNGLRIYVQITLAPLLTAVSSGSQLLIFVPPNANGSRLQQSPTETVRDRTRSASHRRTESRRWIPASVDRNHAGLQLVGHPTCPLWVTAVDMPTETVGRRVCEGDGFIKT
jgi:hypothetical protein